MAAGFGIDRAANIRYPTPLALAIPPGFPSGCGARCPSDVRMEGDGALVQTDDGLAGIVGLFVGLQHVGCRATIVSEIH